MVRTASSFRTGTTAAVAWWCFGANMKPKPISSMHSATCSGVSSIWTPRASSRSADPHLEVAERLPCLATAQPAPAASRAVVVEMLKVVGPPPVPAVSTRSSLLTLTWAERFRIVRARPTSSATVSPFARRAIRKAPIWTGSARPSMISASAAEVWSAVRCVPLQISSIARVRMSLGMVEALALGAEEVSQQLLALRGEDRLRMELNPLGGQLAVTHAHHDVVVGGGELELAGQVGVRDQRVVAARDPRVGEPLVDGAAVVLHLRVLAVDRVAANDLPSKRFHHRLVPEADAEDWRARFGEGANRIDRDARLLRRTWARRNDEPIGLQPNELGERRLVIADDAHLRAQLPQVLNEVVGEGVVVVDHEDAHSTRLFALRAHGHSGCSAASSTARKTAFALFTDSLNS